jgi:hypothetical protein
MGKRIYEVVVEEPEKINCRADYLVVAKSCGHAEKQGIALYMHDEADEYTKEKNLVVTSVTYKGQISSPA